MAQGNLAFPATGLDSFVSVDLANIWNVLSGGGSGAVQPVRQLLISGFFPTVNDITFSLFPLVVFYAGKNISIKVLSLTYAVDFSVGVGTMHMFMTLPNVSAPSGVLYSHFLISQGAGINIRVNANRQTTTDNSTMVYGSSGVSSFANPPLNAPDFIINSPTGAETILLNQPNVGLGGFTPIYVPQVLIEVQEIIS